MKVDLEKLEERFRVYEDIEAIKKLKAKYWRCVDKKLWDEIADCFAEDAVAIYAPDVKPVGRDAILKWLIRYHGEGVVTAHAGHNPEIEIASETEAKGTWTLRVHIVRQPKIEIRAWSRYEDEYVKKGGEWVIKSTSVEPILVRTTQVDS